MSTFTETVEIAAPRDRVWEVLADIGSIHRWNPGVKGSQTTSENPSGEGSTRHCDLQRRGGKDVGFLEERAFDWREGEGYRIEITESNLPFREAVISFTLADDGEQTRVGVSPAYALRFGPLGRALDALVVRRRYRKGMRDMLAGLKQYVETGVEVDDRIPEFRPSPG